MKRFDLIKTIQLLLLAVLAVVALTTVLRDTELSREIAVGGAARILAVLQWMTLGISFLFLFYDFNSFAELRRENMELDNAVYSDALTGIANRYSVDQYIGQFQNRPLPPDMGCVTVALYGLSEINAKLGHSAGDTAIREFSEILMNSANGICFIGRNGGNKFVAIFRDCTPQRLSSFQQRLTEGLESYNQGSPDAQLHCRTGVAFQEGPEVNSVTELVALSDRRAWEEAEQHRNAPVSPSGEEGG